MRRPVRELSPNIVKDALNVFVSGTPVISYLYYLFTYDCRTAYLNHVSPRIAEDDVSQTGAMGTDYHDRLTEPPHRRIDRRQRAIVEEREAQTVIDCRPFDGLLDQLTGY